MKNKKQPIARLVIALLIVTAAVLLVIKHFHIEDFCVIKPGVLYTSGQPRRMDYYRLLYRYHIATIVNTRIVSEHIEQNWRNEEIAWTRSNAVHYFELPIEKGRNFPNQQTQDQFLAIMADKDNLPVLLHGSSDDKRVAMLVAVWLERDQGYNIEQTIKAMKMIIDDRELTEDETKFIRSLSK